MTGAQTTTRRAGRRGQIAPSPSRATSAAVSRVYGWLIPAAIGVATIVAFLPVLGNGFVDWDDDKNFINNPHFRGLGSDQLHWMWTTFHMGHYVPLSWMTLGLDYTIWGMNPTGYHLTSLLLHAANAIAFYALARRLLACASPDTAQREPVTISLAAAAAALLFAVHPLRVESVAWATERRDVLSGLFVSMSILAYVKSHTGAVGRKSYWAAVGLFVCALLSKATAMTVPVVLVVINVYPLRRLGGPRGWWSDSARRVYRELVPFALLALAAAALSIIALHPPTQLAPGAKIAVSVYGFAFYLWKEIVPTGLSPLYEMPAHVDPTAARFVISDIVVAALLVSGWMLRRRAPAAVASLAVFMLVTLPMLGVVQNGPQIAADRYTYQSGPALALLAGAGALWLSRRSRTLTVTLTAGVIVAFSALTWEQSSVWRSSETLWQRVLDVDENSSIAHSSMANVRYRQNRVREGIEHSQRAIELAPNYAEAYNGLGVGLARDGRIAEAISAHRRALALEPRLDEAEANLGVCLAQQGDVRAAIEHYRRALEINPNNVNAEINWGNALARSDRNDEAIVHYQVAARIRPDNADAQEHWGVALAREKKYDEAIVHFRAALDIDPSNTDAREYLIRATQLLEAQRQPPREI